MTESDQMARGRGQLFLILGVLFVMMLAPVLLGWMRGNWDRVVPQSLSLLLSFGLLWNAYRGAWWARQVTVALAFIGGIVAVILGLLVSLGSALGYLLFGVGLVFIGCGFGLITLPDVNAYLRRGRE